MKSFSKRVASFSMAAAMVLSLAAVSPVDAEAATAKITKKSSITAGKTYTYNVKNVTKSQYIKVRMSSGVTVKYNNKTVKKASTKINGGKTIALKVKAADKVANYKATVKAVIYNKKTNKKVKTLTTQSTVKCTQLAVTNVQTASTTGKYLVVEFNKALTSLSAADVTIRNKATGELKGVEKAVLASNGKSATITLVGSEDAFANQGMGANANNFVVPNVDYTFSVTQSGVTATKDFTVDAVKTYVTVKDVDPVNRTIAYTAPYAQNTNTDTSAGMVRVPETVDATDLQELLGTTVNIWYDKNNKATKLTKCTETIKYGSFKVVSKNVTTPYLEDLATGEKYYFEVGSGLVSTTQDIVLTNGVTTTNTWYPANGVDHDMELDYAKVVLYSNGNIRTIVDVENFNEKALVSSVKDSIVYSGAKTAYNLKDYLILKAGKTASIADIQKDDVVYIDTANKVAEIYNDKTTGALQAVYDSQYKFGDKLYQTDLVKIIDGDATKGANKDYMKALLSAGKDVTVYFDRAKQPAFITGETKWAASSTDVVVLTKQAEEFTTSLNNYIRFTGFNGTAATTYDVNVADLSSIYYANLDDAVRADYGFSATEDTKGTKIVISDTDTVADRADDTKDTTVKTQKFVATGFNTGFNTGYVVDNTGKEVITAVNANALLAQKSVVELEKNDAGKVVGIKFMDEVGTMTGANVFKPGKSSVFAGSTAAKPAGAKEYQITASTPVYEYDTVTNTVRKTTYGAFAGTATTAHIYTNHVNRSSTYDVAYIVAETVTGLEASYVEAVIGSVKSLDGKLQSLVAVNGMNTKEYTKFRDDSVAKTPLSAGKAVTLGIAADGETIVSINTSKVYSGTTVSGDTYYSKISTETGAINDGTKEVKVIDRLTNGTKTLKLAPTEYTVVKKVVDANHNVTFEPVELSSLSTTLTPNNKIEYHVLDTNYVDVIVVYEM